ncbi:uncharacterized protein LOC133850830 [Drosophila sulfurigaster albostrigata]|uniref:uncharacterized protein LOC133850830 n=1 Tax=Drosophila sulfurigaster albostrigata TaxID=89887 RepID=UPI002D21C990|nr:uncharacterized protein LOC133850830 [Drosophila sulfurigaster albostrigata]
MNLTYLVIFALLSIVGAAPTNDLQHDLRKATEDAQILINKDEIRASITLAKSIMAHNFATKEENDQLQSYCDKLSTWNVTISRDFTRLEETGIPKFSKADLDPYTNGEYDKIISDFEALKAQRYATCKANAMEILEAAKKSGVTHILIDNISKFNDLTDEKFVSEITRYLS